MIEDKRAMQIIEYYGVEDALIDSLNNDTRLLHDLNMIGDCAYEAMDLLPSRFSVDMSNCNYANYFPGEMSYDALLLTSSHRSR